MPLNWLSRVITFFLLLLAIIDPLRATITLPRFAEPMPYFRVDQATRHQVEEKLNSTIISEIKNDTNLQGHLDYISSKTGAFGVQANPTSIKFLVRPNFPPIVPIGPASDMVHLELKNVSLMDIVRVITKNWPVQYRIEENAVVFFPINETEADLDKYEATEKKFYSLSVVGVNYQKIDIEDVLKDLSEKSRKNDPEHLGVRCVLRVPKSGSPPPPRNPQWKLHREISILIIPPASDPLSLEDALGYVCQQANLSIQLDKDEVALIPRPFGN